MFSYFVHLLKANPYLFKGTITWGRIEQKFFTFLKSYNLFNLHGQLLTSSSYNKEIHCLYYIIFKA